MVRPIMNNQNEVQIVTRRHHLEQGYPEHISTRHLDIQKTTTRNINTTSQVLTYSYLHSFDPAKWHKKMRVKVCNIRHVQ